MMTLGDLLGTKADELEIYINDPLSDDYEKYDYKDYYYRQFDECTVDYFTIDWEKRKMMVDISTPSVIKHYDSDGYEHFIKVEEDW